MKPIDNIPTGKIQRASKLLSTGAKVGGNYIRHYGEKLLQPELDRSKLDQANAKDIYDSLKSLKGSALKAAQMLSMEKNLLPAAYIEKFSLAQFQVPPLSAPLVRKTFRKYFGAYPEEIFDTFEAESVAAASIGQVHKATKGQRELAVKIQYPGVAESISSDLAIVKPIALRMFNLSAADVEHYFQEVKAKLLEETDYNLELQQSQQMVAACSHLPGLCFPNYYPEYSSPRILTMDWMQGEHLAQFAAREVEAPARQKVAQTLWDWYMYQMHELKWIHADPHPGNFLVDAQQNLIAIDFGCIKAIPEEFYKPYFELSAPETLGNNKRIAECLEQLELFHPSDSADDRDYLVQTFEKLGSLIARPFYQAHFNFGDPAFFAEINALGEQFSRDQRLRQLSNGRGSRHFLYVNRTFFGLFMLLHDLKAEIETGSKNG
jgi:predicted unusual protein kinase regulating ubiquinone biosynthesis (AarF/ABC1/UbiB family)